MKVAACTLVALLACTASAQDETQHGAGARCISGTCQTGFGTVSRTDGNQFTGPWLNGRFVAAVYDVRWAADGSRTYPVKVDANGSLAEGTMVRGGPQDFSRIKTTYTGTFSPVWNPFIERNMSSFRTGRYLDAKGRIYDGEFQFIPSRLVPMGVYIFQGVRIDPEEDEVQPGLFASDAATQGMNVTFYRARPDYLVKLQNEFAGAKAEADRDAQAQAFFKTLLGLTNAGINMLQGARANPGGSSNTRMAFDLLSEVIKGQQKVDAAVDTLGADMLRRIADQPKLKIDLELAGVATSREAAQRVAQSLLAQPRKMTQKEYADLLRQAQQP